MFSFEKNGKGTNPPGPLSYITLDTKTDEELPARLMYRSFNPCKSNIMMAGLSSAGRITKEPGTMWDLSTSTVQQENPGSQLEPGIGLRRAPLIFGDIS